MSGGDAARLAHDVGKYVARVARNVPPGEPVPAALLPLLLDDLYALPAGGRASARFDELARGLADPRLAAARARLAEIDALEARVRAGEEEATVLACAAARAVEEALRAVAAGAG